MANDPVKVHLLDREFLVACAEEERAGLIAAADLVDKRMRALRASGGNPGFDRMAVLVALNMTHELLQLRSRREAQQQQLDSSIQTLTERLERALAGTPPGS